MRRGLYDVDRAGNGKFLAETDEDFAAISTGFPTHLGSHPDYDRLIKDEIESVLRNNNLTANSNFSNLSNQQILDIIDDIEESSLIVLTNWIGPKLH